MIPHRTVDVADLLRTHIVDNRISIAPEDPFWGECNRRWNAEFRTLPDGTVIRRRWTHRLLERLGWYSLKEKLG